MVKEYVPPKYPVLNFIAVNGMMLAVLLGAIVGGCGLTFAATTQQWLLAPCALVAAAVLTGLLASYVEVVRIMVDTLVPR